MKVFGEGGDFVSVVNTFVARICTFFFFVLLRFGVKHCDYAIVFVFVYSLGFT